MGFSKAIGGAGYENITPELDVQIPIISQMAETYGISITTPTGTNKEKLQINNNNLQNIKAVGGSISNVTNGIIKDYRAYTDEISANTFVEFIHNTNITNGDTISVEADHYAYNRFIFKLNDTSVILIHSATGSYDYSWLSKFTIDNLSITCNYSTMIYSNNSNESALLQESKDNYNYVYSALLLDTSRVIVSYGGKKIAIINIGDSSASLAGTILDISTTDITGLNVMGKLSDNKILVIALRNISNTSHKIFGSIITINNDNSLSLSPSINELYYSKSYSLYDGKLIINDSTHAFLDFYYHVSSADKHCMMGINISIDDIVTSTTPVQYKSGDTLDSKVLCRINDTKWLVSFGRNYFYIFDKDASGGPTNIVEQHPSLIDSAGGYIVTWCNNIIDGKLYSISNPSVSENDLTKLYLHVFEINSETYEITNILYGYFDSLYSISSSSCDYIYTDIINLIANKFVFFHYINEDNANYAPIYGRVIDSSQIGEYIQPSQTVINGITKTKATTTEKGKVYILTQ